MAQSVSGRRFARHAGAARRNSVRGRRIPLSAPSTAAARAPRAGAAAICNAAPISAAQNAATNRNPFAFRQADIIQASESARCPPVATSGPPPPSPRFASSQRKEESGLNRSFLALWPDESALGDDRRRRLWRLASAGRKAQESQRCSDSDENFLHGLSPFINHNRTLPSVAVD